jgi:hypothetical protein
MQASPAALPDLATLVCGGNDTVTGELGDSMGHIRNSINRIQQELPQPYGSSISINQVYIPFLVRSILELSFTALIARLDPFRILTLRQVQLQGNYSTDSRNASSIQWSGDIVSREGGSPSWSTETKPEKMSRSLLGEYQGEVVWKPAFIRFLDMLGENACQGDWSRELQQTTPESFLPKYRQEAMTLYSSASKGIHHEFVVPVSSYFDEDTLKDMVDSAVKIVSIFSAVVNFSEHALYSLDQETTLNIFVSLEP